jgi:putative peptidoglycan lipid II flippase
MLCTLLSRLLGIVKARVLSSVFGAGATADVINFTFNIPNNFRKLFAEGAVNSAIIPAFSNLLGHEEKDRSLRLFSLLVTYQTILLIPLVVVSYLYGRQIIGFLSDFDASQIALGARLLPFFIVYLATISLSATFNGVLQAHQNFLHAYLSPLLFSLCVIIGVLTLSDSLGAMSMAYAALAGGLLQGTYSYVMLRRYGYRIKPAFNTTGTDFKPVVKAWSLVTLGMGMQILVQMISFLFASTLQEGSVTAFTNSTIFFQTPYGIFFNAISAVSLPLMSRSFALGKKEELKEHTRSSLLHLATLLLPSTIILYFFSRECVHVVLQTGNYTAFDSELTALVLRPFLVFMLISAWYAMLLRLGYSTNRYRLMTIVTTIQNLLDIALMWVFLKAGLDIRSLPLANGISYLIGMIILLIVLRDVYSLHTDGLFAKGLLRIGLANLPVFLLLLVYHHLDLLWYASGSNWRNLLILSLLGLSAYLVVYLSYRIADIPLLQLLRPEKKSGDL